MVKYYCDHCGKELRENDKTIHMTLFGYQVRVGTLEASQDLVFCDDCALELGFRREYREEDSNTFTEVVVPTPIPQEKRRTWTETLAKLFGKEKPKEGVKANGNCNRQEP